MRGYSRTQIVRACRSLNLRTRLRVLPRIFRARSCSEEMGYPHTIFRCWWDNRVIVHSGPLWRLCKGCREANREERDVQKMTWRELPKFYWEGLPYSALVLWVQRRQQCCLLKKPAHKMDCARNR